jgi:hypothetical protein
MGFGLGVGRLLTNIAGYGGVIAAFCVGVSQFVVTDQFNPLPKHAEIGARIDAYRPFLIKLDECKTAKDSRALAQAIVSNFDSGKLQPAYPVYYGDGALEGIRSQIVNPMLKLSKQMLIEAHRQQDLGNFQQAAEDTILSLALTNSVRFSDQQAEFSGASMVRQALGRFEEIERGLSPDQAKKYGALFGRRLNSKSASEQLAKYQHTLEREYAARYGEDSIKDSVRNARANDQMEQLTVMRAQRFVDPD